MIIPISTDAPIYYWPWMTLVLIAVNVVVFLATGFGLHEEGWQISYGQGLHPLEWLTYNFFHYDWFHLIGNMFFLWGFGIVVEGKLGWWKYLLLYLGIGIVGGLIIQTMMLGFKDPTEKLRQEFQQGIQQFQQQQPRPNVGVPQVPGQGEAVPPGQPAGQPQPNVNPAQPQAAPIQQGMSMLLLTAWFQQAESATQPMPAAIPTALNQNASGQAPGTAGQAPNAVVPGQPAMPLPGQMPQREPQFPGDEDEDMDFAPVQPDPDLGGPQFHDDDDMDLSRLLRKPGAAGASLVIYALLAITLVWAPKNEVTCFVLRIPPGTFEIEYMYFCGFRVVMQIIYALTHSFQMSSEMGHAIGAILGFGAGALFVKRNWVDCENWDLFAVMKGTHGNRANIGGWRVNAANSIATPADAPKKSKKKKSSFKANIYDSDESPKKSSGKTSAKPAGQKGKSAKTDDDESGNEEFDIEGWESINDSPADEAAVEEYEGLEVFEVEEEYEEPEPKLKKKPVPAASKGPPASAKSKQPAAAEKPTSAKSATSAKPATKAKPDDLLRAALQAGLVADALKIYRAQKTVASDWEPPEPEFTVLCDGLHKAQQWPDAIPLMQACLARYPKAVRVRLKLAAIYAEAQRRPRAALKLLAECPRDEIPEKLLGNYDKIRQFSQKLIDLSVDDRQLS